MAHLAPDFRHDLFVSYASGDVDGAGVSPLKTWSLAFTRELQAELRTMPDFGKVTLFVDESNRIDSHLERVGPLTQQLREAASSAAFLLLLMSPHYLKSGWCRDERTWWLENTGREAFPDVSNRIFIGNIWPTQASNWPPELCDEKGHPLLGIYFHPRPADEFRSRPLGWPDPTGDKGEFREAIVALAGEIGQRIDRIHRALVRKREDLANLSKLGEDGGQALYLHARERDSARWEKAFQELADAGYAVFPHAPEAECKDPRLATEVESEVVRQLSGCDGLLIVPGEDARSLSSDLAVMGHQRRNSARAFKRKPLPCAVIDSGLALEGKPRLQQSAKTLRIRWIEAQTADWTHQLGSWLREAGQSGLA
jgi:hypothetical protein